MRTFNARRGRTSLLTESRLDRLMPRHGIPMGGLDPQVAFGRVAPLVLDVGAGHGAAAVAYAAAHPEHDVLAVDVHSPGSRADARGGRAARHAEPLGARRGRRGAAGAAHPATLVAAVHLFFPDPWPKARHAKRRFVSRHTLDLVADRLVDRGRMLVATDHDTYAAHAHAELSGHPSFDVRPVARPGWRPTDGFEAKGIAAGRTVTDLLAAVRR